MAEDMRDELLALMQTLEKFEPCAGKAAGRYAERLGSRQ